MEPSGAANPAASRRPRRPRLLRLRFGVDAERQLWLEGFDLVGEQQLSRQILGIVE